MAVVDTPCMAAVVRSNILSPIRKKKKKKKTSLVNQLEFLGFAHAFPTT